MVIEQKNKGKKAGVVLAALLMGVCLTGCTNTRMENELAYRQTGLDCMQSGDYAGAIDAFDRALSHCLGTIGDTEMDICYYKAAAQYASGDAEGALATYDALLAYDKKEADAYYLRGCLRLARGEGELAFADFANAVAYNPNDYELYIHIYKSLAAYDLDAQGAECLKQAFAIKGNDAEHLSYRGELYLLLGEYENALAELNAALEKGSTEANLVLAQVYEAQGDTAGAETCYKAYIEAGAEHPEAYDALAELYMAKSDYQTALTYVRQGLALPEGMNCRELLQKQVACLEYTADFAGAWQAAQEYTALYPNDPEMQREYIFLKNRQNSVGEGLQIQAEVETADTAEPVDTTEAAGQTEPAE